MTETPDIKYVHNLRDGVQYAVVGEERAIFRNDKQVVLGIADRDIDLLCELHDFLDTYLASLQEGPTQTVMETIEQKHPENPTTGEKLMERWGLQRENCDALHEPTGNRCYRAKGHEGLHETDDLGGDSAPWSWGDEPTPWNPPTYQDLTWEGFEVRGEWFEEVVTMYVKHRKLPEWGEVAYDYDMAVREVNDPDEEYGVLRAMACLEWWRANGLPVPTEEEYRPEWKPGTRLVDTQTNHSAFVAESPHGRVVISQDGTTISVAKEYDDVLAYYEEQ